MVVFSTRSLGLYLVLEVQSSFSTNSSGLCFSVGAVMSSSVDQNAAVVTTFSSEVEFGTEAANCEMPEKCAGDTVAVLLSTGKENSEGPKICFNGRL